MIVLFIISALIAIASLKLLFSGDFGSAIFGLIIALVLAFLGYRAKKKKELEKIKVQEQHKDKILKEIQTNAEKDLKEYEERFGKDADSEEE